MSKPPLSTPLYTYHPRRSLNSSVNFLTFCVILHIHCTIIMSHYTSTVPSSWYFSTALPSPLLPLPRSHYHREQHTDTYPGLTTIENNILTHAWNISPFVRSEKTLGVSSLNFFQPHLILANNAFFNTTNCTTHITYVNSRISSKERTNNKYQYWKCLTDSQFDCYIVNTKSRNKVF